MKDQFVNHTQALALKELGYSEYSIFGSECSLFKLDGSHTFYMNGVGDETYTSAPLKQQVFRWFREEHKVQSLIQEYMLNTYMYTIDDGINSDISVVGFETYEEAESACIDKLIMLANDKMP